jgi:hypothetical protein
LHALNQTLLRNARHAKWPLIAFWVVMLWGTSVHWWRLGWSWVPLLVLSAGAVAALSLWARWQRERAIRERAMPLFLRRKLRDSYPHLAQKDIELVERGLRQFFMACNRSPGQFVAMPSKVVDALWHEFILHTRAYKEWCDFTLGRFLHHVPAEALGANPQRNDGLRRAWFWACKDESINPRNPTRLPLLFALDAKLEIEGGFCYVPDCRDINRHSARNGNGTDSFCGTGFSDGSCSGDSGSFGGADAGHDGSDGGHDGGSDGGSDGGCGGGDGGGCGGD